MAYALHAGSTPFATPSHSSVGSSPFGQPPQYLQTPLQPRTSNVPQVFGQDPFSSPFNEHSNDLAPQVASSTRNASTGLRFKTYDFHNTGESLTHRPVTSSPLAHTPLNTGRSRGGNDDDDMEEEDDRFSSPQPSSPLSRVSSFPSSSLAGTSSSGSRTINFNLGSGRRQSRYDDDDDLHDAVNPSPLVQRRRGQYKATGPSLMSSHPRRRPFKAPASPTSSPPIAALFENPRRTDPDEDPRKAFLRDRLKKQYFAKAIKAREDAVKARRKRVDLSGKGKGPAGESDDEDMNEEESVEALMNDELFGRMMANAKRKEEHAYKVLYAQEVGSSFDPDLEDASRWEEELSGAPLPPTTWGNSPTLAEDVAEEDFLDIDEDELEAYAEEYARAAEASNAEDVLKDFEDIPEEELFVDWNWNSEAEVETALAPNDGDHDMDMS